MSDFVLTKPAEQDLDQIKTFLIKKAGPTVARKVFRDVRVALDLIGKEPGIGHTREDLTTVL